MIPPIHTPWQPAAWGDELKRAFRSPAELLNHLGVRVDGVDTEPAFPMLVPRGFADRMRPDPADPLLRQVLPLVAERREHAGFVDDPLGETHAVKQRAPGLIQKYQGRALLITTPSCAVNCRYCFRRHFPYATHRTSKHAAAVAALAGDPSISEAILSGGDPLLLPDDPLGDLIERIDRIPHVERIRIHTRIPVVLPERTTESLLEILARCRSKIVMVIHANHPNELNAETERALACYKHAGALLLNQAVLLRGVNDAAPLQIALAQALFRQDVLPYYLHLPDRVSGTRHFFVPARKAQAIYRCMQAELPGYLLPKLVKEVPGGPAKAIVSEITRESTTI